MNSGEEIRVRLERTAAARVVPGRPTPPSIDARRALQQEPAASPVMYQTWRGLLFLHWEWDPDEIQATLPRGLYVDTHGGKAYVAVTPFCIEGLRAAFLPEIPGASSLLGLNVRTYVHDENGVPGVWFYSLDCNHSLAAVMARFLYDLPYHVAAIQAREQNGLFEFKCQRRGVRDTAIFHYRKEPRPVSAPPGSLPFFLTERYLLFARSAPSGPLRRARIHHAPWELFHAQVGTFDETMLRLNHLDPKLRPPSHRWIASPMRVKIYALDAPD